METPDDEFVRDERYGRMEWSLSWLVVVRLAAMIAIPFLVALLTDNLYVHWGCWILVALLAYQYIIAWGSTAIALHLAIIPAYLFFEINAAPRWLAYLSGVMMVFQVSFLRRHIRAIMAGGNE
jgi:hypothetical protein